MQYLIQAKQRISIVKIYQTSFFNNFQKIIRLIKVCVIYQSNSPIFIIIALDSNQMENHPPPAHNPLPSMLNIVRDPIQPQASHNLNVQNASQINLFPQNPINQLNSASLVQLNIPGTKPIEMNVTVTVSPPYGNISIEGLKKQILFDLKIKHGAIQQLQDFRNSFDLQTTVSSIKPEQKEISPKLFSRLKAGFEFYLPSNQQTASLQKQIEECFFKDKPAQKLLSKIMKFLGCNAICAFYLYCSVMFKDKKYHYQDLLDPLWSGPKQLDQISPQIFNKCQQLWAKDRADLANYVYQRLKSSKLSNIDIFQSKGRQKYITQMMEHFQLCPNKLGQNYLFAFQQLIQTASKIVGIVEILYIRSSLPQRNNPQSEINKILSKCLIYLTQIQSKHGRQAISDKTLKKLKNTLFQIKMEKLLSQIVKSHEYQTKNQVPQIQKVTYEQFGDFAFVYKSIFCQNQIQSSQYLSKQLNLLINYQGLQNVQKINANTIILNGIKHRIKNFESQLQTIPQKNANYRKDFLTFLTLYKVISKLEYSQSQQQNPQKLYPGADETWSQCFEKQIIPLINSETLKANQRYEINCMFNFLLKKIFEFRTYSAPIVMLLFLDLTKNNQLQIDEDLASQVFKHYLSSTSQNLHIFIQESFNLHKNLFDNQNLQQIIGSDQLYTKCLKGLIDKAIGLKHLEKGVQAIFDSKIIFIQYANHFLGQDSKEARKNSFDSILNEVVKLLYRLDQNNQANQLGESQNRCTLINDLLLTQFQYTTQKEDLLPFYNQCKKHQENNNDFICLMKKLKKYVRKYFMKYLGYKLQKRLLQSYVNNPQIKIALKISKKNQNQKEFESVCKMSDKNFNNFIQEIKQFCNSEEQQQTKRRPFQSKKSSLGTQISRSELKSIEPFSEKQLNDLKSKLSYEKSLCIVYYGELLKKVWNKITPVYSQQVIKKPQLSLRDFYSFHENYILALDIGSNFIDQALLIAEDTKVDLHLYIDMITHVNQITTNLHHILKNISHVIKFLTNTKSLIQSKDQEKNYKKNQLYSSISNIQNFQEVLHSRKIKLFNSVFTPALLRAITKHLYIKITMFMIAIKYQQYVNKSQKFNRKQVKQYVSLLTQTYDSEGLMTKMIVSNLISLIGYLIKTQYKSQPKQIQILVVMVICFITKDQQIIVADFKSLIHIVQVLNNIPIQMQNLIHMFAQDEILLKIIRYTKQIRCTWQEKNPNNLPKERKSFENQLNPKQAAELTLKYIQELTIFTIRHYTKILYPQLQINKKYDLVKCLELKTQDVNFLSNVFNLTMNIVESLHLSYDKQGRKFSSLEKSQFVYLLALNIKLVEIFYQKLLHILTFDRIFPKYSQITESSSKPYENLAHMVQRFKYFIQQLQYHHEEKNKSETHTVEKCLLYITQVMIQVYTRAGYCYQKIHMRRFLDLGLSPPKMPDSEFFKLLIVQEKAPEQNKKYQRSKIVKLRQKGKEQSLLVVSQKYMSLFQ